MYDILVKKVVASTVGDTVFILRQYHNTTLQSHILNNRRVSTCEIIDMIFFWPK